MEGINRTPWSDGDRVWLAGTASCAMLVGLTSSADLHFPERGTAENFSWCSCWSLLLTGAKAEAWLSLLGLITAVVAKPTLPNRTTGVSMKCLRVDRAAVAATY